MFKLKPEILMLLCRLQQNILNMSSGMIFTSSLLSKVHSIIIHVMFLHQQKRKYMKKANFRPRLTPRHLTGRDLIGNVKIILGQGEVTYRVRMWFCKTPPPGYICHRCNVAGHCIHHFPTNGNSNYNVKRVKPPTGIPKSILVALIHCQVVQLQLLNQKRKDAFDKKIEGLPSTTRSVGEFTSRCCFQSFCVTSFRYMFFLSIFVNS
ncbi:uncharacterized protein LOC103866838 isoform X2 [Brassica rapa]|uniref:uncharacterized protein LOC103866838 isoform X2 n=1 Tax=Brassica campestris TaxID=3711 RepID=UPI000871F36B|nr:uncharacterized protein LOC103866838 isoform X2 [Brassica rapa]